MKKLTVTTIILTALAIVLRVLSQIFIINQNGVYCDAGIFEKLLRFSLPLLLGATAILSLVVYFKGKKKDMAEGVARGGRLYPLCILALGILVLVDSGIRLGEWVKTILPYVGAYPVKMWIKQAPPDIVGIIGVFAGIYFGVLFIQLITDGNSALSKLLGLFAPAYICARAIVLFFESFKYAAMSGIKLEMLSLCAAALLTVMIAGYRAGAAVALRRVKAVCLLSAVFIGAYALPDMVFNVIRNGFDLQTVTSALVLELCSVLAIVITFGLSKKEPEPEPEPENEFSEAEFQRELDLYINDIPESEEEDK
ncbi:MAG: hypothetical protein IJ408_04475 [Clostridia bacterium]|nr:hypothetical protein [Clostridia bacterium]